MYTLNTYYNVLVQNCRDDELLVQLSLQQKCLVEPPICYHI